MSLTAIQDEYINASLAHWSQRGLFASRAKKRLGRHGFTERQILSIMAEARDMIELALICQSRILVGQ